MMGRGQEGHGGGEHKTPEHLLKDRREVSVHVNDINGGRKEKLDVQFVTDSHSVFHSVFGSISRSDTMRGTVLTEDG